MNCPTCNQPLLNNEVICPNCGSVTTSANQSYAPPVQQQYNPGYNFNMSPTYAAVKDFASKASSAQALGIVATVLMFGIGFIFSIIVWVKTSGLKNVSFSELPPEEDAMYQKALKQLKTAKILSFMPIVGIVLSILIGIVVGVISAIFIVGNM